MNIQLDEEETSINDNIFFRKINKLKIDDLLKKKTNYYNNIIPNNFNMENASFDDLEIFSNFVKQTKEEDDNKSHKGIKRCRAELPLSFLDKTNAKLCNKEQSINKNYFLNKKRKREQIVSSTKIPKENKYIFIKFNRGRKKKIDKYNRKHNQFSKDNIINKIKGYFFRFIRDITKKNSIDGKIEFKKFKHKYISDLKKDKNENLFKTKIKDILSKLPLSEKYKKFREDENKIMIDKIYKENKEKNIIKILELTFNELFIIFRRKLNNPKDTAEIEKISKKIKGLDLLINDKYDDINFLIEKIRKKFEKVMNKEKLDEYIKEIETFCNNYEQFFNDKISRSSKKQNKRE